MEAAGIAHSAFSTASSNMSPKVPGAVKSSAAHQHFKGSDTQTGFLIKKEDYSERHMDNLTSHVRTPQDGSFS